MIYIFRRTPCQSLTEGGDPMKEGCPDYVAERMNESIWCGDLVKHDPYAVFFFVQLNRYRRPL